LTAGALALTGGVAGPAVAGVINTASRGAPVAAVGSAQSAASFSSVDRAVGAVHDVTATSASDVTLSGLARGCERSFDAAQRRDMESFRDYDAAAWRAVHDPAAVSIFASGARIAGIDKIIAALAGHFADREAGFTWKEINRRVDGCRTAFIEYETVYRIDRVGFYQRALTVVTYTFSHGRWLVIMDQGTLLPRPAGS
jgi:hypothetical protein